MSWHGPTTGLYDRWVAYKATQDTAGLKLNGLLIADGDVGGYAISPEGERVVYQADQDSDEVDELYVTAGQTIVCLPLVSR